MKRILAALFALTFCGGAALTQPVATGHAPAPVPLVSQGHAAEWIFVYKMNASAFPSTASASNRPCPFGGHPRPGRFSQQYAYATDAHPQLQSGPGLLGTGLGDPIGATFSQIYNGDYFYVVWNDQFQDHPMRDRDLPWGHSKGMIAWNDQGEGLVLQVTTPAWPGAASARAPRTGEGNTLGCLTGGRNNLTNAQHFFALRLSPHDVELVLAALENASVVTNIHNAEIASLGGPPAILAAASRLGVRSRSTMITDEMLSSHVRLISKPSDLNVAPWQLVSAALSRAPLANGPALRSATWWAAPRIPTTDHAGDPSCWGFSLHPGPVAIATTGMWDGRSISLIGGSNHAKIGVSVTANNAAPWYSIFGDLNQQGALSGTCRSSQNARGGLFFVLEGQALHDSVAALISGGTAPTTLPTARHR